jgi:hypothetical protein
MASILWERKRREEREERSETKQELTEKMNKSPRIKLELLIECLYTP